jgi:anti-sigma regulatory factor (Ser/Thr protein kinase)
LRARWKRNGAADPGASVSSLSSKRFRVKKESFQPAADALDPAPNGCSEARLYGLRIAVYDSPGLAPATRDLASAEPASLIEEAVRVTTDEVQALGGRIPFLAVREVIQNLVHAEFAGASISVLDGGREVIVSDRGPGIADPAAAVRPGFTTATEAERHTLRGVGSGLSLAASLLQATGGKLVVESNLGGGTVVSMRTAAPSPEHSARRSPVESVSAQNLGERQIQVLLGLADGRESGPSLVAAQIGCSLATAYRDLARLEQMGLVFYVGRGKRVISPDGLHLVSSLLQGPAPGRGAGRRR